MDQPIPFTAVVELLFSRIKQEGELNDVTLKELYVLFPSVIASALDILDKKLVKQLITEETGRKLFVVRTSKNRKQQQQQQQTDSSLNSIHYSCPGQKFCSCPSFLFQVVNKRESIYCKHLLAVRIAEALGKFEIQKITDSEFAQYALNIH